MISKKHTSLILFVLGFAIFMLTRFSKVIPSIIPGGLAMIIAPVFILRFSRTLNFKKASWLMLLGFLLSANISLWGLFETGNELETVIFNLIRSSLIAIIYFIPYFIDRLIYPKLREKGILSTLIFPTAVTAILFLVSLEGPLDGTGISGIYDYGPKFFRQTASIVGLSGFVFIYSWFASVINYGWENGFTWKAIKKVTLIFVSILTGLSLFGLIKISPLIQSGSSTVKIATILVLPEKGFKLEEEAFFTKKLHPYEATISKIEKTIEKAASNGAKIISTQETAIKVKGTDESKLKERIKNLAKENNIHLSFAYGVLPKEGKGWNKHVMVNNRGELVIDYNKRYLFGLGDLFGESIIFNKGAAVIQIADTPYGRIAASICKDMEFAPYARQAGKKGVDIMFNPSYDYPTSRSPGNTLRPIENGFSFVRPSFNGVSHAQDYNGKILAQMHFDETADGIMYVNVPIKGVRTIYSIIGDLLAWLCVMGTFVFLLLPSLSSLKKR